jgi:hypothetical protein
MYPSKPNQCPEYQEERSYPLGVDLPADSDSVPVLEGQLGLESNLQHEVVQG